MEKHSQSFAELCTKGIKLLANIVGTVMFVGIFVGAVADAKLRSMKPSSVAKLPKGTVLRWFAENILEYGYAPEQPEPLYVQWEKARRKSEEKDLRLRPGISKQRDRSLERWKKDSASQQTQTPSSPSNPGGQSQ